MFKTKTKAKIIHPMPKGVSTLYIIQAFSTFPFAILYASLPLYLTHQMHMSHTGANTIVGVFLAFNYILQFVGGLLGGRFLSNRSLFFITLILQSLGLGCLALGYTSVLFPGLSLILVGGGINTTCYNAILTQRFKHHDPRRESAFILSYGAMNFGFFSGYLFSGFCDYSNQYQSIFAASIVTNLVIMVLFIRNWQHMQENQLPSQVPIRNKKNASLLFILALIPLMQGCFYYARFSNVVIILLGVLAAIWLISLTLRLKNKQATHHLIAYQLLAVGALLFWTIYLTGPMGITLFIKNNVDKHWLHMDWATQWIKNLNPIIIMIGAPLLTLFFEKLKSRGVILSISLQFSWAFLMMALSFACLSCGILYADTTGFISLNWVAGHMICQGLAELFIGPIGYAMIGKIAPLHLRGVLLGIWMLVLGIAASMSHLLSNQMVYSQSINPLITNADYFQVFWQLGVYSLIGALLILSASRKINELINGQTDSRAAQLSDNSESSNHCSV